MWKPARNYLSELTGITSGANPKGKAICMSEKVGPDSIRLTVSLLIIVTAADSLEVASFRQMHIIRILEIPFG
jgi:hypothetical protein